jgi:diacylglycerol O-acyltransferase
MPQRLTPLEVSLLALDTAHTPGHVGTVDVFDAGPDDFDYERLIALIRERIAFVPRYRQRVRGIPAQLAGPVWVDDESFDLTFHVRRSALPRPGTLAQLREFVGRVLHRRLDRSRPLWEIYLVEGLESGRRDRPGVARLDGPLARDPRRRCRCRFLAAGARAVTLGVAGRRSVRKWP